MLQMTDGRLLTIIRIIKSVLVLENGLIPPNVNFEKVNPKIPAAKWRLQFPLKPTPWPTDGLRRISVNSFGVGGTNGHVVIDDAYHYLRERGLTANHYTQPSAPTSADLGFVNGNDSQAVDGSEIVNGHTNGLTDGNGNGLTNGHAHDLANGHVNGLTNGNENGLYNGHANSITNGNVNGLIGENANGAEVNNAAHTLNGTRVDSPTGEIQPQLTSGLVNRSKVELTGDWKAFDPVECPPKLIPFSAFDEEGCNRAAKIHAEFLGARPDSTPSSKSSTYLNDLAHTMSQRSKLAWRSHVLARSLVDLETRLAAPLPKPLRARTSVNVAFVFTGQGAQWYGMGRELLCYSVFRESLAACRDYLKNECGCSWDLLDELAKDKRQSCIDQAALAQPACTALQVALIDLFRSWNVQPGRVVGHSSGEIAAAYCAGLLSRESAWRASYFRGMVTGRQTSETKGAMLAVGLGPEALAPYLDKIHDQLSGELVVACLNSPRSSTVSGDVHKVEALRQALEADGLFARKLKVPNAYHSAHMQEFADEYVHLVGKLQPASEPPQSPVIMFSSVTGEAVEEDCLSIDYWTKNLLHPVRFSDALAGLCFSRTTKTQATLRADAAGANVFADVLIELGPHGALQGAIRDVLAAHAEGVAVAFLPALDRTVPGADVFLTAIGHLNARGYPIDIDDVNNSAAATGGKEFQPSRLLPELPGYQFNHSNRFWYESRLSQNYRLRKEIRHDLFGAPVPDWDVTAPRFRNFIRISEQPWLRDHVVTDNIILPGVGYVIAVVEAARQLANPDAKLSGFRLRDVNIKRALIVPDTKEGIEVMLTFKPVDESSVGTSAHWRRFQVVTYNPNANDWLEHCTGYVAVDYEASAPNPVDQGREAQHDTERWAAAYTAAEEQCQSPWDFTKAYERMARVGLNFGPLFQNCSDVRGTFDQSGQTMGSVTVPDVASVMPKGLVSPHLMHPACMDSLMHYALAAIMDATGKNKLEVAMVPRFIKDIWISATQNSEPGHVYRAHSQTRKIAFEKFSTDVVVWDGPTQEPRIAWRGIEASPLDSAAQSSLGESKMCHEIEWIPYVDLYLEGGDVASFAEMPKPDLEADKAAIEVDSRMQLASVLLVLDALKELDGKMPATTQGHLCRYFDWMKHVESDVQLGKVVGIQASDVERLRYDTAAKAELYAQSASDTAFGELAVRMGSNIVPVLRGETDPLQLMFGEDDILDRVYKRTATLNDLPAQQKAYLNVLAKHEANLRVLEIGAGTGSSTAQVLNALAPIADDGVSIASSVSHYMYTDISAAFFEQARQKFQPYINVMEYQVLDAEQDITKQEGFELESYDLIVAQNVIHTTTDLTKTLSNLRRLLKPGGRLLLQEGTRQDYYWSGLSFGQLSGWWNGTESMRQWMPWVSSKQWDEVLAGAGYTGVRFELPDSHNEDLHSQSLFVAQNPAADVKEAGQTWKNVVLVTPHSYERSDTESLVQDIKDKLAENLRFQNITTASLLELKDIEHSQSLCIVLAELDHPVIADLPQAEYEGVRKMLVEAKGILWSTGDDLLCPQYGAVTGLMRTTRWERDLDDSNLVTLKISEPRPENASLTASIRRLCEAQFSLTLPASNMNGEYMLQGGRIWTSRLREATRADEYLQTTLYHSEAVPTLAKDAGRPIKLTTTVPGLLEKLEWVTDDTYYEPLSETEVEIEIKAVGLNFRDLMIAMGEHTAYSMGSEASGIISRVGSKVVDFAPGDRVVYICGLDHVGCMHTYGRLDQSTVAKVPDGLSLEMAAGLPVVYATVIYSLRETGRLMAGESILIHAAAGGVGQAAIRYAQHIGAEIYVTLSTAAKKDVGYRRNNPMHLC
jgi:acyl transferase domain-containing protein